MKLLITEQQWQELPESHRRFITLWKGRKRYANDLISLEQCIELLIGYSRSLHYDDILHGVKDNVLDKEEIVIGWDGEEMIDILWFYVKDTLKRINYMATITEEVLPISPSIDS